MIEAAALDAHCAAFRDPAVRHAVCEDYRSAVAEDFAFDRADREVDRRLSCPVLGLWPAAVSAADGPTPLDVWHRWSDNVEGQATNGSHLQAEGAPYEVLASLGPFLGCPVTLVFGTSLGHRERLGWALPAGGELRHGTNAFEHQRGCLEQLIRVDSSRNSATAQAEGRHRRVQSDHVAPWTSRQTSVYTRIMTPCLCTKLRLATRRLTAAYDAALAPVGINIGQYFLLRTIRERPRVSLTEIGQMAELDRSTVGRNVRVLERLRLVLATRSNADGREAEISLTPDGERVLQDAQPLWEDVQRATRTQLGTERLSALEVGLAAI